MQRFFSTCLILALLVPLGALAADKKPKEKKPKEYVKVVSVSSTDNTVTILDLDHSNRTYSVDGFTVITVNGQPGKLNEVRSGMKASIAVSGGGKKLGRLEVTEPPEPKPEKKKKK